MAASHKKNPRNSVLQGFFSFGEDEGTRTLNVRIDSPVL